MTCRDLAQFSLVPSQPPEYHADVGEAARHGGDDEAALFRAAVADAAPLKDRERRRAPPPQGRPGPRDPAPGSRSGPLALDQAGTTGRAPGVNRPTLRRLAAGEFPVQATLDLHRHTFARAEERIT